MGTDKPRDILDTHFGPDPDASRESEHRVPANPLRTAVEIAMARFGIEPLPHTTMPEAAAVSSPGDQAFGRLLELHELDADRRFQAAHGHVDGGPQA